MKVDRRGFLSFVVGGAAGTALSPLPWKMMDDFSIWSQVWPWVPVPKGGESICSSSVCSLCPGSCGITVRSVGDRAIKIEGSKNHPISNGKVCGFGLSGLQLLYGPTRVKSPMKKVGGRKSGRWQKISWEEGISIASEKLRTIRDNGKSENVAFVSKNNGGTVSSLIHRFCAAYGTSYFLNPLSDNDVANSALKALTGVEASVAFDFENSDFILSLGSGLLDGWSSPVRTILSNSKWNDSKVEIVHLDSFLSNTAAMATRWIPVKPGAEADLLLGISAFIIQRNLCDVESLLQRISKFRDCVKILIRDYSLESVSAVTGVEIDTIASLAESFIGASRPLALCSSRNGSVLCGFRDYVSAYLLNIIGGSINRKGGLLVCKDHSYVSWPTLSMGSVAKNGLNLDTVRGVSSNDILTSSIDEFVFDLNSRSVELEALFVSDFNLCHSLADVALVRESLQRIPFLVSFSPFMDETSAVADLILPDHVYLEKLEDIPALTGSGKPVIGFSRPVISPQFNTQHIGDTIINIACSLGENVSDSFPWRNYGECLEESVGDKWSFLSNTNFWIGDELERVEVNQLNFEASALSSIKLQGNTEIFPLVLIPRDSLRLPNGNVAAPPFLVKILDDTTLSGDFSFVDINPVTAEELGFDNGDYVMLSTMKGQVKVRINFSDGMRPGVVSMLMGLGHGAHDEYIAGKGVNVNDLMGPIKDPVLGHDVAWGIRAKLAKV